MKILMRLTDVLENILVWAAAIGLVLMTVIIGWQVFGRYVLNASPSWSEQASLVLMIWYVSLAAAAGVREGFHIRIVAIENIVGPSTKRSMRVLSSLIVAACGLAMLIWGGELVVRTWSHTIPSLGVPRGLAYLALPIAGSLIVLFSIEKCLEEVSTEQTEQTKDPRWS